jgi:hypothetical protein
MIALVKIATCLAFAFLILHMLALTPFLVSFMPPVMFFTAIFSGIASIAGLFYYQGGSPLFYGNLTVLLSTIAAYCLFFLLLDYSWWLWIFRLWTAIVLVFYGLIIFKKLWVLQ